ncbi:SMI1/KNR4 family protein [Pseudomonas huanghezhanensis]|uniref:SMI1/KNR4 family protein n=1 Tax=Pseudomonas huanghezhanensis TaxID=3002903 RepID=UPI002285A14B|nr:SMI1/KNR4 family protein [Pseudomonas sp. BSw22131]
MQVFVLMQPEKEIEPSSIATLEKAVGFKLPASFIELYLKFNGGIPNRSWVVTEDGYEPMQISDFKPICFDGAENASDTGFIEGCYKLMCERQVIPHTLLPFAVDDGGNFFCLDMLNGSVVFYAVDTFREEVSMAANQIAAQRMVAKSFDQFITELEEEPQF